MDVLVRAYTWMYKKARPEGFEVRRSIQLSYGRMSFLKRWGT